MSGNGADVIGTGRVMFVYSLQGDFLVRLVLERLSIEVDALPLYFSIGFDGANHLSTLAHTEFDRLGGGVP
jgi:hypothetical protein